MATTPTVAYPIKEKHEKSILQYVDEILNCRTGMKMLRSKLELCDRIVSREPRDGEKRLEVTVPIAMPQCDTMVAYLTSVFLASPSIFPVTTTPSAEETAQAINVLFGNFAKDWQWKRNLLLCFKDAAKYDLMVAECSWKEVKVQTLSPEIITTPDATTARLVSKAVKSGFSINHLDPYNTFWDTSVPSSKVAEEGEFAGYIERKSTVQLVRFLNSLPANNGYNSRLVDIKNSSPVSRLYFVPKVTLHDVKTGVTNWNEHFDQIFNKSNNTGAGGSHEVVTIYCRIIPSEFKLPVPAQGTPQIWKFVIVNMQYVVYAECKTNAHDYLPIVVGQPYESNLAYQQKALPEELASLQALASNLWSMEISSNRRIISNREVYNPSLIDSAHINSASETAKIPLRNSAYGAKASDAIYSIPYNDPAIGSRSALAQGISQFASVVTGQNQVANGQFVKGNKTNAQFDAVLARSDARQVAMAVLLEDQFFGVLKHLLLYDLIQYQKPIEVFDLDKKQTVSISANSLMDTKIQFTINDSLSIGEDSVSPETIMTAMQTVQAVEQLQTEYDVGKLFAYLMSMSGVKHLGDMLKSDTPTQPQVPQMQQGGQSAPQEGQVPQSGADPEAIVNSPIEEQGYLEQVNSALGITNDTPLP